MKDALKFRVGSSVKCLEAIYTNLHFLPTKMSLLIFQNSYSFILKGIAFSCQSIANVFICLLNYVANQDCIHSVRTTLMKNVANRKSFCTLKSVQFHFHR